MLDEMREHAETVGARGMPMTRQVLIDAADRIDALEKELGRLIDCVSDEDAMSIANVLAPESNFSVDNQE